MAYDEKIKAFRTWATGLGCPPNAIPSDDALRDVFKSPNSNKLFEQLQERIHPRQYVQELRENLLIAKMTELKGKVVPVCERSFLPREMQNYLKMKDMVKEKEAAQQKLADVKKEYDNLAATIKSKNIQMISAKHRNDLLQSRCDVLQLKLESLNNTYEKELQIKEQILATMPVKLSVKNASEKLASKAVEQALKELDNFYNISNADDTNSHQLAEAKSHLWSQMRQIFSDTPNVLIFNAIMKIKHEQLQHIMQLHKKTNSSANGTGVSPLSKPPLDSFDVQVLKTKADLLGLVAKYMSAKDEVAQLEERFASVYSTFVDELQKKVNHFNGITGDEDEESEEIISEFMLQYNMRTFYQAQNEFYTEQIEKLRVELESGAKQLENHEMLLASIKQMYREIDTSVNRIQQDVVQLSQIKEKILYSKNILKNLLEEMNQNTKSHMLSTKLKGNMSLMGMESFSLANDSVFSSTKLDNDANTSAIHTTQRSLDNTVMPGESTSTAIMPSGSGSLLPSHVLELNAFTDMPLEKFSCIPKACLFFTSANPFIVESQELASTVQLAPGYLLTPYGALQEVSKRILWASAIAELSSDLKLNFEPLIVDPHNLKLRQRRQHEEIVQLLDNIEAVGAKAQHQFQKVERIYKFVLDNPLRHYVPPNRKFNDASYADYESEFNLYYRMATSGGSIKKH